MTEPEARRTIRRYAHELYPHPKDGEVRTLAVDVPYQYARAIGFEVNGTSWFNLGTDIDARTGVERTMALIREREIAFLADALLQGLVENEAWRWAQEHAGEESGELIGERAELYGVDWAAIKPYPCGPEPDHHDHFDAPDRRGWRTVHRIQGKESECPDCTEPDPTALAASTDEAAQ